jgi:hypothetical protein
MKNGALATKLFLSSLKQKTLQEGTNEKSKHG